MEVNENTLVRVNIGIERDELAELKRITCVRTNAGAIMTAVRKFVNAEKGEIR